MPHTITKNHAQKYRFLLAFGSNQGNRKSNFSQALSLFSERDLGFSLLFVSPICINPPFIDPRYNYEIHEEYSNFVTDCTSFFPPVEFYHQVIVPIEDQIGHCRSQKWQPRMLDVDILFSAHNDAVCFSDCTPIRLSAHHLSVPHKDVLNREILIDMLAVDLHLPLSSLQAHFL